MNMYKELIEIGFKRGYLDSLNYCLPNKNTLCYIYSDFLKGWLSIVDQEGENPISLIDNCQDSAQIIKIIEAINGKKVSWQEYYGTTLYSEKHDLEFDVYFAFGEEWRDVVLGDLSELSREDQKLIESFNLEEDEDFLEQIEAKENDILNKIHEENRANYLDSYDPE